MKPAAQQKLRGSWVILGIIIWLILASSITLEQGQETAAKWGSTVTLVLIGLLILLAVGRVALIPMRAAYRSVCRWAVGRFR